LLIANCFLPFLSSADAQSNWQSAIGNQKCREWLANPAPWFELSLGAKRCGCCWPRY